MKPNFALLITPTLALAGTALADDSNKFLVCVDATKVRMEQNQI
jgi:hypothetical protein